MQTGVRVLGWIFGLTMILLSLMVTVETIVRKVFSVSIGGVDELSGYAVALVGPVAFAIALAERSHIRINILYLRLSKNARRLLDAASIFSLTILSMFLTVFAYRTVLDTDQFNSLAQTPWATPLIYPQSLWLLSSAIFSWLALVLLARGLWLARRGDWLALDRALAPGSIEEELEAELQDLKKR